MAEQDTPQNAAAMQDRRASSASLSTSKASSSSSLGEPKPVSRSASIAEKVKNLKLGRHRSQHYRTSSVDLAAAAGSAPLVTQTGMSAAEGYDLVAASAAANASAAAAASTAEAGVPFSNSPADYELCVSIGFGASAIVYQATHVPTGKKVAIKMIDLDLFERNQIDELRREIQIMSLCKHPQLLQVYGSFVQSSKLWIVTPYLAAGSCLDIMKTAFRDGFEETSIATILKQALQGLEYLHRNNLIHRDVKAGNLLVADSGLVQLADFGVSATLMDGGDRRGTRKTFVGTPCWMAPEVMEQSGYDYKADIWSFGITAIELATGHAPFAKYPPIKVLMLTLQNEPPTLDRDSTKHKYSKTFKEMIDFCLQKDPSKRPPAEKLLQHAFFKQAKKCDYLCKSILQGLPEVTQRPHNHSKFGAVADAAAAPPAVVVSAEAVAPAPAPGGVPAGVPAAVQAAHAHAALESSSSSSSSLTSKSVGWNFSP